MTIQITKKIKSCAVVDANAPAPDEPQAAPAPTATVMSETIARPEFLSGHTYKIAKSPACEHALYVTINDIVLDPGTPYERRQPFEIFINSKSMDQFQWVVAMTRIISAVFRKGGDVAFLVDEMKSVFDPHGGYFRPGGLMPSLVAEIGGVIERHLQSTGAIAAPTMDPALAALVAAKRQQHDSKDESAEDSGYPASATRCSKCHQKSVVVMDGCQTCLACGHSKCG